MLSQWINISLYPKKATAETITAEWRFKNSTNDVEGITADVTDTTGFARAQVWALSGVDWLYAGTIFGINGFVNLLNNSFFFGNVNTLNFYLINTATNQHQLAVNGNVFNFNQTNLDLGAKNLLTTGAFSDSVTPIVSGHTHIGTGNEGAIIPHVNTQPVRALDTVYTNSGARPILVWGSVECSVKAGGDVAYVELKTDAANPPVTVVQLVGVDWQTGAITDTQTYHHGFYMVVQPGHKYELVTTQVLTGVTTLTYWNETPF